MMELLLIGLIYIVLKVAFVVVNEHEGIRFRISSLIQRMSYGTMACLSVMFF